MRKRSPRVVGRKTTRPTTRSKKGGTIKMKVQGPGLPPPGHPYWERRSKHLGIGWRRQGAGLPPTTKGEVSKRMGKKGKKRKTSKFAGGFGGGINEKPKRMGGKGFAGMLTKEKK